RCQQRLGFVRFKLPAIDDGHLLVRKLGRKRRTQRSEQLFLRQSVRVIARLWTVHGTTMPPERRPDRTDTRAAGSLLPPQLAASAGDFALVLGLVRTAAQTGEIPPRSFVQQVRIDFGAEYRVGQLDFADFLSVQIDDIYDWHNSVSLFSSRNV